MTDILKPVTKQSLLTIAGKVEIELMENLYQTLPDFQMDSKPWLTICINKELTLVSILMKVQIPVEDTQDLKDTKKLTLKPLLNGEWTTSKSMGVITLNQGTKQVTQLLVKLFKIPVEILFFLVLGQLNLEIMKMTNHSKNSLMLGAIFGEIGMIYKIPMDHYPLLLTTGVNTVKFSKNMVVSTIGMIWTCSLSEIVD